MNMQVWGVVLFYGAVQGLVLAFALFFNRRGRRAANALLSAMLISSSSVFVPWWLGIMGWIDDAPQSMYAAILLAPAIGPLYYFYTRTLLSPGYKPRILVVIAAALLPGSVRLVEMLNRWLDSDAVIDKVNRLIEGEELANSPPDLIGPLAHMTYALVFIYLAWRIIRKTEKTLVEEFSDGARRHVLLLKLLISGLIVISANSVAMWIFMLATHKYVVEVEFFVSLMRCVFIQLVAVAAFFIPEGFSTALADLAVRHRRAPLEETDADRYLQRLNDYMAQKNPHRDENLRLADLADGLAMPRHVLSQLINERLNMNFFDFINKRRVEEAQALMKNRENDHFTLLAIAEEAGFNSKASFNRAFRKHAGTSPSQYRRDNKE